ncbi:MAG: AMP-binding protein [Microthrixaceae bacterium]|nr:AMP-binding protein [Microthrixaceae bacterium]
MERTIGELFAESADRHADREAITSPTVRWTYRELAEEVRRMAGGIASEVGSDHGRSIAILCDHDGPLIAALMAVICAGHAVVIVDPTAPLDQNSKVLDEARPAIVLADELHREAAGRLAKHAGCQCLELSGLNGAFQPPTWVDTHSPAMLAFTSGTSDTPKGAVINQGVVLNAARGGQNALGLTPDDRLPLLFPLSLTIAAFPVFLALLTGACVAVLDVRAVGIAPIAGLFERERITIAFLAPTVARFMLDGISGQRFEDLRMVMLAGEPVDSEILAGTCAAFGCDEMAVAYGITETGLLTIAVYSHDNLPRGAVSCGYPIPEVDLVIVDDNGVVVGPDQVGEIVVVSNHLFDGYVGRPELGRLVLGEDPSGRSSRSSYRTGDLGRVDENGVLTLEGRSGSSVKVRGRMVGLGEVETDIRDLENVLDSAVLATPLDGVVELVAYVVPKDMAEAEPTRWRAALLANREPYRVPTRWVTLDEFPLLPNGKVNRRALPHRIPPSARQGSRSR